MPKPAPTHCLWCKLPVDLRTRRGVTLTNGDRLHHACHMALIADVIAHITRPVIVQLPPSFSRRPPTPRR